MTQKLKLALGAAAFVVLIAAAAVGYNALNSRVKLAQELAAEPGSDLVKAPDFSMTDKDGNTVTLSGLIANGKPVVLNFWASWCPPCKVEMPEFDRVYQEFGGEVQFVMLNLADGQRETIEKGGQYVREQGFSFPVFFDNGQEAAYTYGIRSIPATLFINRDGFIAAGIEGAINEETLRLGIGLIASWNQ